MWWALETARGFACSRCCSPWRYYEPADLFGAGAAWGLKENLPARQGSGEWHLPCGLARCRTSPSSTSVQQFLEGHLLSAGTAFGRPVQRRRNAERGDAGRGHTGSSKASSASLLQRLLRRSCVLPPPAWKGERPGRPVPLLRARRKMLSAKEPQGDTALGGDLCSKHASFTTTV